MRGPFIRVLSLAGVLAGIAAGVPQVASAATMTIPAGYEAVLSNTLLGGCNANTFGYEIGSGALVQVGTKPAACLNPLPGPAATAGPVSSPQTLRLYLQDSSCNTLYYSDETGSAQHALVVDNGNGSFGVAIDDGGAGCNVQSTTSIPSSLTNSNFSATVTIVAAPPTVTVTAPAVPSGQSGYFNNANLAAGGGSIPVAVSATEGTGSGMKSISCTDNGVTVPVANEAGSGTESMTGRVAVSANGTNAIACLAASNASATGNTGGNNTATLNIDSTAPSLIVPASPIVVGATSLSGATVSSYGVSASDADDTPSVACTPAAPTLFPIGDTTVNCHATDRAGNAGAGQFVVRVQPPPPPSAGFGSLVSAGSRATAIITCSGVSGQICGGTVFVTTRPTVRKGTAVVLASVPFSVAQGSSDPLSIVLDAAALKLLQRSYSLPATLTLPDGVTHPITFAYRLVTTAPDSSWDSWTWLNHPCRFCYTKVSQTSFFGIPRTAKLLPTARVKVNCVGRGCPAPRSFGPGRRSLSLGRMFAGRRLGPGAVIELVITAPNAVGREISWTMVAGHGPQQTVKCMPPGDRRPLSCAA